MKPTPTEAKIEEIIEKLKVEVVNAQVAHNKPTREYMGSLAIKEATEAIAELIDEARLAELTPFIPPETIVELGLCPICGYDWEKADKYIKDRIKALNKDRENK